MPQEQNSESLWTCLHDGIVTGIHSDLAARSLRIEVDVPFHWEFHQLSPDTRFELLCEDVTLTEILSFDPWPLAIEPPREMPWEDAQVIWQENSKKGRLESVGWQEFVAQLKQDDEWTVLHAELVLTTPDTYLHLELIAHPDSAYREVRVHAPITRFMVSGKECTLSDFQAFGDAYWNAWAARSNTTA